MSNAATAISNMFLASGGQAVAACPKTPQTKGKAPKQAFADTKPLARLREEVRSNKNGTSTDDIKETKADAVDTRASEPKADSVQPERAVKGDRSRADRKDGEPVQEEVSAVAQPVDEAVVEGEPAETSIPVEVAVSDGVVREEAAETTPTPEEGKANAATVPAAENTPESVNEQAVVQSKASDEQAAPVQMDTAVSVTDNRPEGSGEVVAKGDGAANAPVVQDPSSGVAVANEESKAVVADQTRVVDEKQNGESASAEVKTAAQGNDETVAQAKSTESAEPATSVKPQTQGQVEVESTTDGAKTTDTDKAPATIREAQTPERNPDAIRQEDAQTSAQQDSRTRPQPQGPVQEIAAPKPANETAAPTSEQPVQGDMELTVVSQDGATDASPRIATEAAGQVGLDVGGTRSPVQDVGQQILDSIHASITRADKQIQIRLDPPELGTVTVRIAEQGDQIQGILQVSRDDTRREIEQALPQVLKGLQDAGIQVRRLEVVVSDQPDRSLGRDQLQQDAWAQQQQQQNADHGYRPQNTGGRSWSAGTGFQQSQSGLGGSDRSYSQGSQDRIDMLM